MFALRLRLTEFEGFELPKQSGNTIATMLALIGL